MQPVYVKPSQDDFSTGVAAFFASLGWTYLTHRYARERQGGLVRVLTLSGLDSWSWEHCAIQLVHSHSTGSVVLEALALRQEPVEPVALRTAVVEIWTYAVREGASVGKPPFCPSYLTAYGYTPERYVADLQLVYNEEIAQVYKVPWPEMPFQLAQPLIQPVLLREAVAIMGLTAGAIEQLVKLGGGHDDHGA